MRTLALALALSLAGCAILKTQSVESVGAERCTTSPLYPALDTAAVVGAAAFATYTAFELEDVDQIAIPAAVGTGVLYTVSAIVGYARATRCKRARIREGIAY